MKSGSSPAAPAAPPSPIESLGAADKELKAINSKREADLTAFETMLGQRVRGRSVSGGARGSTTTKGGFNPSKEFFSLSLDEKVRARDANSSANRSSNPYGGSRGGTGFAGQLDKIRSQGAGRAAQLNQFITDEMKVLDESRRTSGRGRRGNIVAGSKKRDPNLSDASTLGDSSKTLL